MPMGRNGICLAWATVLVTGLAHQNPAFAFEVAPSVQSPTQASTSSGDLLGAADRALAGSRLVEAKDLLDQLESESGARRDARLNLLRAEWLIAVGRAGEALPLLAAIEGDERQQCRVISAKAMAFLSTAALDDADRLVADVDTLCGDEPVYWRSLARLHLIRERPLEAVAALRRAIELQPGNDEIRGEMAVALISAGDAADAVRFLSDFVTREPERRDFRINLDYARGMLGQRPQRAPADDDMFWSGRLQYAGLGARRANLQQLAEALLGQAMIERPRYDKDLWRQYADVTGNTEKGPTLVSN